MNLELQFGEAFCYAPVFRINGVRADPDDFGEQYDRDPGHAEDYGCGDMQFTSIQPTDGVLQKYGITLAEYALVAAQLEKGLSFGACGLCA